MDTSPVKNVSEFKIDMTHAKAAGLLVVWYSSAAIAAWHMSQVMNGTEFEAIEVSCLLMFAGLVLTTVNALKDPQFWDVAKTALKLKSTRDAAFWHYFGTLSMCLSTSAVSASLAQIVKSTEPVLTITLSWLISGVHINSRKVLGVILICAGVALACAGNKSMNSSGVLYAVISAFCFPMRNISSHGAIDSLTTTQRFGLISTVSCLPAFGACCVKWLALNNLNWISQSIRRLTILSISHLTYNVASYAFLGSSNPIFHSVANICKRLVVMFAMYGLDRRIPTTFELVGVSVLFSGFVLCSDLKFSKRSLNMILLAPATLILGSASCMFASEHRALSQWASGLRYQPILGFESKYSAVPYQYSPSKLLSCVEAIRRRHIYELKDLFADPSYTAYPILLVDPAQHNNVGDVLIAEGEKALAHEFGWGERNIHECCVQQARSGPSCQSSVSNGTYRLAMWHGGGNWGDLYYGVQLRRIASLRYLFGANLTVIGMPQSYHYRSLSAEQADLNQLHAVANSTGRGPTGSPRRLVLLWRQRDSFNKANRLYSFADNRLVPDIAFWTGPFLHQGSTPALDDTPQVDLLLLLRSNGEITQSAGDRSKERVRTMLNHVTSLWSHTKGRVGKEISFRIVDWKNIRVLRQVKDFAEYRTKIMAAVRLLDSGTVIITDRLHATILSFLAIKPVFYVDQTYGKIQQTLDVAFSSSADCRDPESTRVFQVGNLSEALVQSYAFLKRCWKAGGCKKI